MSNFLVWGTHCSGQFRMPSKIVAVATDLCCARLCLERVCLPGCLEDDSKHQLCLTVLVLKVTTCNYRIMAQLTASYK